MTLPSASVAFSHEHLLRRLRVPPRSHRALRYRGDDRAVALSALTADGEAVRALYAVLTDFEAAVRAQSTEPELPDAASDLARSFPLDRVIAIARSLGSGREELAENARHALHDVRGGALTSLLVEVQRTRMLGARDYRLRALRTLVGDHLKVMRNAFLELDDERRTADLAPRPHSIERLAETLARVGGEGGRGSVRASVHCSFLGTITTSCIELGALDRAVLNVVNNAVRHAASDEIAIVLTPASDAPGSDLRIVVANAVEEAQADALRARFGDDLGRIFVEPFSTTGSGEGLKICVDFVSSAYGLPRAVDAVGEGVVGAALDEGQFVAWMHWPTVV